MTSVILNR